MYFYIQKGKFHTIINDFNFAGQDVLTKAFCSRALDWVVRFLSENRCCHLFLKLPEQAALEKGHSICFYNEIRVFQEYHQIATKPSPCI